MNAIRSVGRRRSWALLALVALLLPLQSLAAVALIGAESGLTNPGSSIVIGKPAGVASNHVLVAHVSARGGTALTITAPSGWSLLDRRNSGTSLAQAIYVKVAGDSEPSTYTWSFNGSTRAAGGIIAYSGVDTTTPVEAVAGQANASSTVVTAPGITTSSANARVVGFFGSANGNDNGSIGAPSGMTARYGAGSSAGPNGVTVLAADQTQASAGSSGSKTTTGASSGAVSIGQLLALKPSAVSLDHIRLLHTGNAVTCEAASVTLRACADASCSALASTDVSVTLTPATGWVGGNSLTIPAGSDVTRSLAITTPQDVTLGTSAVSPTPANATRCFAGASETCVLSFADTGLLFSSIATQTAGAATGGHTLRAVRKSDNSAVCTTLFSGPVSIDLASQCIDPDTCAGRQVAINGQAIAANPASGIGSYSAVTLDFGSSSTASFSLAYPDVGRISLSARHLPTAGGSLLGSSNAFVVKPAGFAVGDVRRNADDATNPAPADADGPAFLRAGQSFRATVTALTASGAAAPNYGRELVPEGVRLSAELAPGLGLVANPGLSGGDSVDGAFAGGAVVLGGLGWDEVGIIRLRPSVRDGDYLGVGDVSGDTGGNPSGNIGRFTPARFDVGISQGCAVSSGAPYTYSGQPFTATVFARRNSGDPAQNYQNAFARDIVLSRADGGDGSLSDATLPQADNLFSAGVGSSDRVAFHFASEPSAPAAIPIRATDSDGISSAPPGVESTVAVRSGRLRLIGGFGSGRSDLALPLRIELWRDLDPPNGVYAWDIASSDACTHLDSSRFDPDSATLSTSVTGVSLENGKGALTLAAPNAAGTVDVSALLDGFAPWLQHDWDGDGDADNPSARAGFEFNPGNRRQIFKREVIGE